MTKLNEMTAEEINLPVARELEAARIEAGISVSELARRTGIPRTAYRRRLDTDADGTINHTFRISAVLGTRASVVLARAGSSVARDHLALSDDAEPRCASDRVPSPAVANFVYAIRELQVRHGVSDEELADRAALGSSTFMRRMENRYPFDLDPLERIARVPARRVRARRSGVGRTALTRHVTPLGSGRAGC